MVTPAASARLFKHHHQHAEAEQHVRGCNHFEGNSAGERRPTQMLRQQAHRQQRRGKLPTAAPRPQQRDGSGQ